MIKLYKFDTDSQEYQEISQGTFDSPATVQSTPGGLASAQKFWIRNNNEDNFYTDIKLSVPMIEVQGLPSVEVPDGKIAIKILSGHAEPTDAEWTATSPNLGEALSSPLDENNGNVGRNKLPDLGSAGSADINYYPIWILIETPASIRPGDYMFYLKADYTEGNV
jgi:hypothetical protein